jgi:hypothetical protein
VEALSVGAEEVPEEGREAPGTCCAMGVSFNAFCALSAIEDKKPERDMVVTDEGEREESIKLNTRVE